MKELTLKAVVEAKKRLVGVINPTPLIFSDYFSNFFGKRIYFKPENLQFTGAFKIRGAYNKLSELLRESSVRRVVCASAGNHAQGLAFAGRKLGFQVVAVMPEQTPIIKVRSVKDFGATVVLFGETFEDAYRRAKEMSSCQNIPFIDPFDDEAVMAGQGTIGLEILKDLPAVRTIVAPVGGGGLIGGVSLAVKKSCERKNVAAPLIIGVRSATRIAEGILCKDLGNKTSALINRYVDRMVEVGEDEIASAILMLITKAKLVVEGAGAAGLAAMLSGKIGRFSEPIVLILSGGNIDIGLMGKIIRKGLHGLSQMVSVAIEADDRPGVLAELTALLAEKKANIYQIVHERSLPDMSLTKSRVRFILEVWNENHITEIIETIKLAGYKIERL